MLLFSRKSPTPGGQSPSFHFCEAKLFPIWLQGKAGKPTPRQLAKNLIKTLRWETREEKQGPRGINEREVSTGGKEEVSEHSGGE